MIDVEFTKIFDSKLDANFVDNIFRYLLLLFFLFFLLVYLVSIILRFYDTTKRRSHIFYRRLLYINFEKNLTRRISLNSTIASDTRCICLTSDENLLSVRNVLYFIGDSFLGNLGLGSPGAAYYQDDIIMCFLIIN